MHRYGLGKISLFFTLHKAERGTVYVDWEESPEWQRARSLPTKREQIYNLLKGSSRTWHTAKRIEEATGISQTKVNRELAALTEDRKVRTTAARRRKVRLFP